MKEESLRAFAQELVNLTDKENRELAMIMRDEYGIDCVPEVALAQADNYDIPRKVVPWQLGFDPSRVDVRMSKHQCNRLKGKRKYKKHKRR